MKSIYRLVICAISILTLMLLAGCPQKIPGGVVESGDYFSVLMSSALHAKYDINFSEENTPTISISYQIDEETLRTATFQLDGYDESKKIGYKLITILDKTQWEQEIEDGNVEAPDLQYYDQIQSAAIEYEYPVIFIDISEYQNDADPDGLLENQTSFFDELYRKLFNTPAMKQWLEDNQEQYC